MEENIHTISGFTLPIIKAELTQLLASTSTQEVDEDEINDETAIAEITPVVRIKEAIFAVKGDISVIGGQPKAGKTSVCAFILATAMMKEVRPDFDCLDLRSTYCNGKKVVYIDTEQPQSYTNKLRRIIKTLLDCEKQPSELKVYNLRKYDSGTKLQKVLGLMKKYPDAHLWIIDGVADLIKDPNDTKEAFGIIETFMMQSDLMNTAIILHIHENPGTSKLRGNLGSEAERKCGGAIAIKKIKGEGIHCIEPKVIRGSEDFEPIYFRFDRSAGRMVSLNANESASIKKATDKNQIKLEKRIALAKRCLITGALKYSDFVEKILEFHQDIEGNQFKKGQLKAGSKNSLIWKSYVPTESTIR